MSDAAENKPNDRGEITVTLDGTLMTLRPSYEAIVAIEAALGRGLVDIARDALTSRLTLGETAQVVCECVRAWAKDVGDKGVAGSNATRVAHLILNSEGGLHAAMQAASAMLSLASTGGYDASGNVKPLTTKTTADGAIVSG